MLQACCESCNWLTAPKVIDWLRHYEGHSSNPIYIANVLAFAAVLALETAMKPALLLIVASAAVLSAAVPEFDYGLMSE